MDKNNTEQCSSPAGDSSSGALETSQQRADSMGDDGSFFGGSLSVEVIRRVNALRNLQVEHHKIEAEFFEEVHALECRYLSRYQTLYDKRSSIVKGSYEPTDAETKCAFDEEDAEEQAKKDAEAKKADETNKDEEKVVGIPEFWLTVLRNSEAIAETIREHDEPVLKHLTDIRITMQNEKDKKGFTIEFEFSTNDYFNNAILTKSYTLRTGPDEHEPLAYEGPEIIKSEGCTIDWKKGKNVTVKLVKKRQKHKNRGTIRVVTKEVQTDSFFNFFTPPTVPEDAEVEDNEEMRILAADFEIGHMLRDSIVPKAVLYYTGEAGDEDEDDYDEDDEDDEDDDEDDDDDDQEEDEEEGHGHHHAGGKGGHQHGKHGAGGKPKPGKQGGSASGGAQPAECKQQ